MDDLHKHLKTVIQDILQKMRQMTAEEINEVINTVTAKMSKEEKNYFESALAEEILLATGWKAIDKSQWTTPNDFQQIIESIKNTQEPIEQLPPWIKYPSIPCYSIGWRMGAGEHYMLKWFNWISDKDNNARIDYFKKYRPLPFSWLVWIASSCGHRSNPYIEKEIVDAVLWLEKLELADFKEFETWADAQKKALRDKKNQSNND